MIVTDYPDAYLIENLAHNIAVNLEEEERRRVDVQVGLSRRLVLSMFFYNIGVCLGQARSFLIRTPISTIPVFKVRPSYSLRSYLQPLTGTCEVLLNPFFVAHPTSSMTLY